MFPLYYRLYTKPDCPHCDRAKQLLTIKKIPFDVKLQETPEAIADVLSTLGGWRSFPAIFAVNDVGISYRFVGGADQLEKEVKDH